MVDSRFPIVALCLLLVVAPAVATGGQAAGAASQATQATPIDSCTVIVQPGRYVLTGDVRDSSAGPCIVVGSPDVVLDGQGHELNGTGGPGGASHVGVFVRTAREDANVTLRNLSVVGWGNGLFLSGVSGATIENVTVRENALDGVTILGGTGLALRGATASDNGRNGVSLFDSSQSTVSGVVASDNGRNGLSVFDGQGLTVSDLAADGNGFSGLSIVNASTVTVTGSRLADNRLRGVLTTQSRDVRLEATRVSNNSLAEITGLGDRNTTGANVTVDGTRISFASRNVSLDGTAAPAAPPAGAANVSGYLVATPLSEAAALELTVHYDDAALSGVDEATLALWRYRVDWSRVNGSIVDAERNAVTGRIDVRGRTTLGAFGNVTATG